MDSRLNGLFEMNDYNEEVAKFNQEVGDGAFGLPPSICIIGY
jgi:hypothetical protein